MQKTEELMWTQICEVLSECRRIDESNVEESASTKELIGPKNNK